MATPGKPLPGTGGASGSIVAIGGGIRTEG
jgi:hypothetical protein